MKQDQPDNAEAALREAVTLCNETLPPAAGAFRASLALLIAKQGKLDEARDLLTTGEPQVEIMRDEHGKFLCKKGQILHIAGEADRAAEALAQAITIAGELKVEPESELGQALEALAALLGVELKSTEESGDALDEDEEQELAILEGERLLELGNIERGQSNYAEAEVCFNKALAQFRQIKNRKGEADAIAGLGILCEALGDYPKAIEYYTYALTFARDTGVTVNESAQLRNLGDVFKALEDYAKAIEYYTNALTIARETGNKVSEGTGLGRLGSLYKTLGDYPKAIDYFAHALNIAREIGNKRSEGASHGNLGNTHLELGEYPKAIEHYNQALNIAQEMGDRRNEGIHLGNLGALYEALGDYPNAVEHYTLALNIAREIGNKTSEGIDLGNLGNLYLKQQQTDDAEQALREAIRVCETTVTFAAGAFRGSLALLLANQGQLDEARDLLATGESQVEAVPIEHTKFLCKKGQVLHIAGEADRAAKVLAQAKTIAGELNAGPESEVGQALEALAAVLGVDLESADGELGQANEKDEEQALAILEGERLLELGSIDYQQSNYDAAKAHFTSSLGVFRSSGHRTGEAQAIGNLGLVALRLGNNGESIALFRQALTLARELGNAVSEGSFLGNLGSLYHHHGDYPKAIAHYEDAITIARQVGNNRSEGHCLGNLGNINKDRGLNAKAIEYGRQALLSAQEMGDKRFEATHLGNLDSCTKTSLTNEATKHFRQAITIAREVGDKRNEGIFLKSRRSRTEKRRNRRGRAVPARSHRHLRRGSTARSWCLSKLPRSTPRSSGPAPRSQGASPGREHPGRVCPRGVRQISMQKRPGPLHRGGA